jgi:hypothetical protein
LDCLQVESKKVKESQNKSKKVKISLKKSRKVSFEPTGKIKASNCIPAKKAAAKGRVQKGFMPIAQ